MSLNQYEIAISVKDNLSLQNHYAKVVEGIRTGTIGKIINVRTKYYSDHEFQLAIEGRNRTFWISGNHLELLQNFTGMTNYSLSPPVQEKFVDSLGRIIELGHTITFPRMVSGGSIEIVFGTIRKVGPAGTLYAKLFMVNGKINCESKIVRVAIPDRATILDKDTAQHVMVAKLSGNH